MTDLTDTQDCFNEGQVDQDMCDAASLIEEQALVIKELAAALNSVADDIDLEAKYASRSGQMVNLEALASYARQAARAAIAKAKP